MPDQPSYDFLHVHTDIPEGMTIREWRAMRAVHAAKQREAQPRVRRACTPAMFIRSARRLLGELGLRLPGRALPGGSPWRALR
jgi:hypothetical protein